MKKIINAIRDFLYNITDYSLIIIVIAAMVVILSWRFDILFSRGIEKEVIDELPAVTEPDDKDTNKPEPSDPTGPEDPDPTDKPDEPSEPDGNEGTSVIATITIPEGSFPSKIADILLNSNLIDDKDTFLNRLVELGLDTRLRSGTFEIEVGTPLDNVIKILANAQ